MAGQEAVVPEASKKKSPLKLILIILLIIVLLGGAFVGYAFFTKSFFFAPKDAETAATASTEETLAETMFSMDGFIVNLKTKNASKRYLKVTLALGCAQKKDIKKLEEKQYQIRDIVITTLRSKDIEILATVEEEDKVKTELAENINTLFDPDIEMNVYYTEYIIQ